MTIDPPPRHEWFWGSHGCALPVGHEPPCRCAAWECVTANADPDHDCALSPTARDCRVEQVPCSEWKPDDGGQVRFEQGDGSVSVAAAGGLRVSVNAGMTDSNDTPAPIEVQICRLCRQPWPNHRWKAELRAYAKADEDDVPDVEDADVSTLDCIALLLEANQGPPGPPGPMTA